MTAAASENEILPVFSEFGAAKYLVHEDRGYQMTSWNDALSHLTNEHALYRHDALARLHSIANLTNTRNQKTYFSDAQNAFEPQLLAAKQRFIRRNSK